MAWNAVMTENKKEEQTFTWRVGQWADVQPIDALVKAQRFTFEMGQSIQLSTRWKAKLKTENKDGVQWIGLFLILKKKPWNVKQVYRTLKVVVKNKEGGIYCEMMEPRFMAYEKIGTSWGYGKLLMQSLDPELLVDTTGSLVLDLTVTLMKTNSGLVSPKEAVILALQKSEPLCEKPNFQRIFKENLARDLGKLLKEDKKPGGCGAGDGNGNRLKIMSRDGKILIVSRGVVSARSPVFRTMLEVDMKEAATGQVNICDIGGKTLEILLEFMYTGRLSDKWRKNGKRMEELVYAAHKYLLEDLMAYLDYNLGHTATNKNCGRLLKLSRNLGMKRAEGELIKYFENNVGNMSAKEVDRCVEDVMGQQQGEGEAMMAKDKRRLFCGRK